MQIQNVLWSKATSGPHIVFITFANLYLQTDFRHFDEENDIKNRINWLVQTFMNICNSWNHVMISLTLSRPAVFLGQSWTGGGGGGGGAISYPWGIWGKKADKAFLLKMSENQDNFLISLYFDQQKCVMPQTNPQKKSILNLE